MTPIRAVRRTTRLVAVSVAALALVAAGCGDDDEADDAASTTEETTGSPDASGAQADAQAFVAEHSEPLTERPAFEPLSRRPDEGKTVVYVGNASPYSQYFQDGARAAAELLGWELEVIDTAVTPETAVAAFQLAISMRPDAVIDSGWPPVVIGDQLAELESMGIPVIAWGTVAELGQDGVIARITQEADLIERGEWVAQWVLAESGEEANVLYVSLDIYDLLRIHHEAFNETLSAGCPDCGNTDLPVGPTDLGAGLPAMIVNALRANPDVNYVVPAYDDMSAGLPEALEAAGLADRVEIADNGGGTLSRQGVADGKIAVNVPDSPEYLGWVAMDALARHFNGDPVPDELYAKTPRVFITEETDDDPSRPFAAYPDYETFMQELWLV